jgi:hypothetical protein
LNAAGRNLQLVRCGPPTCPELLARAHQLCPALRNLGHLPVAALRALLAHGAVLVQPGGPTAFNRRRFPSKLAPYLASGSPVVMPACYPWTGVRPDEHAIMFARGDADDLAAAISRVLDRPAEAREMARRAAEFAARRFDLATCTAQLDEFYRQLPRAPRVPWWQVRKPRIELPLWFAEAARARGAWWPVRRPSELPDTLAAVARSREFLRTLPRPERLIGVAIEEIRQPAPAPGQSVSIAQLYWPVAEGFVESASASIAYLSGRWRRLVFAPQPRAVNTQPRLDPGHRPGIYEIAAVTYLDAGGRIVARLRGDRAFTAHGTTTPLKAPSPRIARWLATGNDPQLVLSTPLSSTVARIVCWIRWAPLE